MARVTVEDCIEKVPNRFDLVMLAAQRGRSLSSGAELTVERDNDKNPVVALREIAEETVDLKELETNLIKGLQKHVEREDREEEDVDLLNASDDFVAKASQATASMLLGDGSSSESSPRFDDDDIDETEEGDDVGAGDAEEE